MTMIDKMAAAIKAADLDAAGPDAYYPSWEVRLARAALEAIREPSASVLSASGMLDAEGQGLAASMWRDMVQEIINEA